MFEIKTPKFPRIEMHNMRQIVTSMLEDLARGFQRDVQTNIVEEKLVDRGTLLRSIKILRPDPYERDVVSTASHGPYVELGQRPHWVPIEPLTMWVYRKGLGYNEAQAEEDYEKMVASATTIKRSTDKPKPLPTMDEMRKREFNKVRRQLKQDNYKKARGIAYAISRYKSKHRTEARPFWRPAIAPAEQRAATMEKRIGKEILERVFAVK